MELTAHAQTLLGIVRAADGWINRQYIAQQLGRRKLNVWDTKLLDDMAEADVIQRRKNPISGGIGFEYQYKA